VLALASSQTSERFQFDPLFSYCRGGKSVTFFMIGKKYKVRRCQVWHMISLRGGSCRKCVSSSRWIATVFIKAPLKLSKISIYGYPFFSRIRIQIYSLVCRPLWYPSALYPYVHSSRHLFLMINQVISPSRTPISTATKQTHIS